MAVAIEATEPELYEVEYSWHPDWEANLLLLEREALSCVEKSGRRVSVIHSPQRRLDD